MGLSLGLLGGVLVGVSAHKRVETKADDVVKYLPMNSDNFYTCFEDGDNFDNKSIADLTSPRRDTFHDGRKSYNALDPFLNTMARVGENRVGSVRSYRWVHKGGYVSFLLGGNNNNFVNVWDETDPHNVVTEARSGFYSSRGDCWDDDYRNGVNAGFEQSGNMAFKYYYIPDDLIGHELIFYIRDNTTGYYGGVTFGDARINQTLEEVVRSFEAHKLQIKLDGELTTQNAWGRDYMLNTLYKTSYYDTLNNAAGLLNADEGFETYGLSNWAYDGGNSTADINFFDIISSENAKEWREKMPANKSDNLYVNADTSGIAEERKYRLISDPFTLSGTGLVSVKMGGNSSKIELLDADTLALIDGVTNPNFVDAYAGNIAQSGARLNTMTRLYIDWGAHVNKKVRIALSDCREGGSWGLAYFDELITKYDNYPSFKVDLFTQNGEYFENEEFHSHDPYNGYILDTFDARERSSAFADAYNFLKNEYFAKLRTPSTGFNFANATDAEKIAVAKAYRKLSVDAKAIVNSSKDLEMSGENSDWWFNSFTASNPISTAFAQVAEDYKRYDVTFSSSEPSIATMDPVEVIGQYELPDNGFDVPEHYHFTGWKVNGTGTLKEAGSFYDVEDDIELVAQFAIDSHTISFNPGEGSGTMADVSQNYGSTYALPNPGEAFTAPDYKHFVGWKVNGAGETQAAGTEITISANVELVAQYEYNTYTVQFSAGEGTGSIDSQDIVYGQNCTLPQATGLTAPSGQQFKGWKVGSETELKDPGETFVVTGNVIVTAQWEDIPTVYVTVSFAKGDENATGSMADVSVGKDSQYTLPECGFTVPGRHFVGWKVGDGETIYQPNEKVTISVNTVITAQWEDTALTGAVTIAGTTKFGETLTAEVTGSNNTGTLSYQWKRNDSAIEGATAATYTLVEADIGKALSCVVTSSVEHGSIASAATELIAKADAPAAPTGLTATACTNKNNNDGSISGLTTAMEYKKGEGEWTACEGATLTGLANGTYYVRYKETATHEAGAAATVVVEAYVPVNYTVSFDANGGSGTMSSASVEEGTEYTLPTCSFNAPSGQQFKGWKVGTDEELKQAGDKITVNGDVTVSAQWEDIPPVMHTVSFNANGGTGEMEALQVKHGDTIELPACTFTAPEGKVFDCWLVSANKYQVGEKITVTSDMTFKASWKDAEEEKPSEEEPAEEQEQQQEQQQGEASVATNILNQIKQVLRDILKKILKAIRQFMFETK